MTGNLPRTKLRVELGDWKGNSYYAEYSQFAVGHRTIQWQCQDPVKMLQIDISSPTTVDRLTSGTSESMQSHSDEVQLSHGLISNVERTFKNP